MQCSIIENIGYELVCLAQEPYYIARFLEKPQTIQKPLYFQNGEKMQTGETIAYLGGEKTSAGYDMLYPVAPIVFRYEGIAIGIDGDALALWTPVIEDNGKEAIDFSTKDSTFIRYAHIIAKIDDGDVLLFTNRGGGGRVIETECVFKRHSDIPQKIRNKFE